MPLLVFALGLVLLAGPVGLVIAIAAHLRAQRLQGEIAALRGHLAEHAPTHPVGPTEPLASVAPTSPSEGAPPPLPSSPAARRAGPRRRHRSEDLEARIGGEWLTWIGVLAIFFGTAFFLAVGLGTHPLAGAGQVWIGLGVAIAFLAAGSLVSDRSSLFLGLGLLGGGTALVFLSIFAASTFHQIIGATTAYLLLAGASALGAALALSRSSRTVAGLTLTGALVTPLLLEPTSPHPLFFPYLAFVNLGSALVRLRRSWPGLVLLAFLGSALLVLFWWDSFFSSETRMQALYGVGTLWVLYLVLPIVARSARPVWRLAASVLVLANAGASALFLWAWLGETPFLRGLLIASIGLLYVGLGRARVRVELARVYELAGLALGAIAIPVHFDLETVTVGWSLLSVILVHLGLARGWSAHRLLGYAILASALGHHVLFDLLDLGSLRPEPDRALAAQWVAGLVATIAILAVASLLQRARQRGRQLLSLEARAGTPLVLLAAAFVLYLVSVQVWRSLEPEGARRAQLGLSFAWALYGGLLITIGFLKRYRPLRLAGVGLLLVLVLKVFTLDLSELDRGERIASFVGVGALLLVISLLYQRGRRKEGPHDG